MSGDTNDSSGKRKNFYPAYAKEHLTIKTEVDRKQKWADRFIRDNLLYYRRMLKYYFVFLFIFVATVVLAYKIYYSM